MATMLDAALALASRGFRVFPVAAGQVGKPRIKGWGREATTDEARLREWWSRWPDDNVAVACGPSGLVVLDLDTKNGKDGRMELDALEVEHGELPPTLRARTPSGGEHLYFLGDAGTTVDRIARGVDTRGSGGQGGYVLAPPSSRPDGAYSWLTDPGHPIAELPAWVAELVGRPVDRGERDETPAAEMDTPQALSWARRYLEEDAPAAVQGAGGDATTFRVACTLRERGVTQETAATLMRELYDPRCQPPWGPDGITLKVRNAYEYAHVRRPGSETPEADFGAPDVEEAEAVEVQQPKRRGVLEEWVWVAGPKWFVRRADSMRLDERSFNSMFNHLAERGALSEAIFKSKGAMRRLEGFCYRPGRGEFEGELYNLWRDPGVRPMTGGAPWLLEHASYLLPDPREAGLLLDWMAWVATRPGSKVAFACLLQGRQGTGKSFLGALMERILGEHNVSRPSNDELHSDFNSWASACQLVVVEELMAQGRRETANKLKTLITDPRVRVNEKHKHPYTIENAMSFLMFTNWDDPIPIDDDDRRYMVLMSPAQPRPPEYYEALFRRLEGDGPALALGELASRDLSAFPGQGRAPATTGKERMRRAGMGDVEAWLLDLYESGRPPLHGDVVSAQDLAEALPDRLRRVPRLHNVVGQFLRRELRAEQLGQRRTRDGRRVLWAFRRPDLVAALTPTEQAERYDTQMGVGAARVAEDDFVSPVATLNGSGEPTG